MPHWLSGYANWYAKRNRRTSATLRELSDRFGLSHPDSASDLIRRGAKRIEQSSEAVRQQKAIEKKLELNPEPDPGAGSPTCMWNLKGFHFVQTCGSREFYAFHFQTNTSLLTNLGLRLRFQKQHCLALMGCFYELSLFCSFCVPLGLCNHEKANWFYFS